MRNRGAQGLLKIVRFNWPWYAAAVAGDALAWAGIRHGSLAVGVIPVVYLGLALGNAWVLASLAVSHWIYDRSGISRGAWLVGIPASPGPIGIFHAGQDEATSAVTARFPDTAAWVFDFFDADTPVTGSLQRARGAVRFPRALPVRGHSLPLRASSLGLVVLAFAAHEIREAEARRAFFLELARVLDAQGRILLVEHLRDVWNALAYGPGVFHFLSRAAWEATFHGAGLKVREVEWQTPFVRTFVLERRA